MADVRHNGRVSSTFTTVSGSQRGYDVKQVDDFLLEARRAYAGDEAAAHVTAETIRQTAFAMVKHGYAPVEVDSALERLEDASRPGSARESSGRPATRPGSLRLARWPRPS